MGLKQEFRFIMNKYKLIKQDTLNKLQVGKIYKIENNILYNDNENIGMYRLTTWQIKNMFKLEE